MKNILYRKYQDKNQAAYDPAKSILSEDFFCYDCHNPCFIKISRTQPKDRTHFLNIIPLYASAFCLSVLLTGVVHYVARKTRMIDFPNARSSHCKPTTRGGGIAFVLLFLAALIAGNRHFHFSNLQNLSCFLSTLLVALTGLIDDKKGLSVSIRLPAHLLASSLVILSFGTLTAPVLGFSYLPFFVLFILTLFFLAGMLNVFNFMDGIDGLAAMEAVFIFSGMAFIYYWQGKGSAALLPFYLTFIVAGFLVWNLPPARIFMGDVGSGFLGFIVGLLILAGSHINPRFFFAFLLLTGVFIIDATFTLALRIYRREPFWQAHCSHAYQIAARYYGSHRRVTVGVFLINLFWLFPLAFLISSSDLNIIAVLALAYCPLILISVRIKMNPVPNNQTTV